jgi:glycosyltransferase involved in cell wall biosynthesis
MPSPEILGDTCVYFNPEDPSHISFVLEALIADPLSRTQLAHAGFLKAKSYSWDLCATKTFDFLAAVLASRTSSL